MKKILITATVQSHIAQFHIPLITMLKESGYEVHVAARNNLVEKNGLKLEGPDKIYDIPFDRSPYSKKNVEAYKQLKKILVENRYDIVHCNTPVGGVITRLVAKRFRKYGMKVYYTAHGFHFYKGAPIQNWILYYPIEKWLARYTDKLIAITKEDYELASSKFKTNVYRIHGVGVSIKKYYPYDKDKIDYLKRQLGFSQDDFILLCTGELNKNKNQSTVIKAVSEIVKDIPNVKLLLAGNGPMEEKLKNLVCKLKIEQHVKLLGYRIDLEKYVNISDVIISASFREGLGLNIIEGMLCRKPVIASSNRGHRELVKENATGYIVSPDNIKGFSHCILKFYTTKEQLKNWGDNSFKSVWRYTADKVLEELKIIYDD